MGEAVGETRVDDKWRITLPPDARGDIQRGQALFVQREGNQITIAPSTNIEEFKRELKGCVRGSKVPAKKLKEIWGVLHDHD